MKAPKLAREQYVEQSRSRLLANVSKLGVHRQRSLRTLAVHLQTPFLKGFNHQARDLGQEGFGRHPVERIDKAKGQVDREESWAAGAVVLFACGASGGR